MENTWFVETENMPLRIKCSRSGHCMYEEIERLKEEIKIGDTFKVPKSYYMESKNVWTGDVVDMTVAEKYPDVVMLVRNAPYGKIVVSPDYTKLYMLEREYGSSRRAAVNG